MSQSWTDNCYQIDHEGPSDLQLMENNFNCLKSQFSGTTSPGSPASGNRWYDTSNKLQRVYVNGNWLVLMPGDTNQNIWSYCNSCPEGMVLVAMVDKVLALKGGSGNYNVSGGNSAGTWTTSHSHSDGSYSANTYHRHNGSGSGSIHGSGAAFYTDYQGSTTNPVTGTSSSSGVSASWRLAGSIGILIRPDI